MSQFKNLLDVDSLGKIQDSHIGNNLYWCYFSSHENIALLKIILSTVCAHQHIIKQCNTSLASFLPKTGYSGDGWHQIEHFGE